MFKDEIFKEIIHCLNTSYEFQDNHQFHKPKVCQNITFYNKGICCWISNIAFMMKKQYENTITTITILFNHFLS